MPAPAAASVVVRPLRPSDAAGVAQLLDRLSETDRYRRWFTGGADVHAAARDAAHHDGAIAVAGDRTVGHGLLVDGADDGCEVAFEVDPAWRHHGIATQLLAALVEEARRRGHRTVSADVLSENADMLAVFAEHGGFVPRRRGGVVHLALVLREP
jgi:GNAT superfamily N-acetyltransferase